MAAVEELAARFGWPLPTLERRDAWQQLLQRLDRVPSGAEYWLRLDPSHVAVRVQLAHRAAALADRLKELRLALGEGADAWLALPIDELLAPISQQPWWSGPSRRAVQRVRVAVGRRASRREIVERLHQAREAHTLSAWFATHEATLAERLDAASPLEADWAAICAALEWVDHVQAAWPGPLPIDALIAHARNPASLQPMIAQARQELSRSS